MDGWLGPRVCSGRWPLPTEATGRLRRRPMSKNDCSPTGTMMLMIEILIYKQNLIKEIFIIHWAVFNPYLPRVGTIFVKIFHKLA